MKNSRSLKTEPIITLSPKRMLHFNVPNQGVLCPGIDTNEYLLGVHCTQCGFHQRDQENSASLCLFFLLIHALIHLVQNDRAATFSHVVL